MQTIMRIITCPRLRMEDGCVNVGQIEHIKSRKIVKIAVNGRSVIGFGGGHCRSASWRCDSDPF